MRSKELNKAFMIVGDTHARIDSIVRIDELARRMNIDTVYQVGDFGISWPGEQCKVLKYFMKRARSPRRTGPTWLSCLGNHDNYNRLDLIIKRQELPENSFGAVPYVEPYTKAGGVYGCQRPTAIAQGTDRILMFGGAESTDAWKRKENVDWWRKESPTATEFENFVYQMDLLKPRFVITHDCPLEYRPGRYGEGLNPLSQIPHDYTAQNLQRVYDLCEHKPQVWFYGHHHQMLITESADTAFMGCGLHGQGYIVLIEEKGPLLVRFDMRERLETKRLRALPQLQGKIEWGS